MPSQSNPDQPNITEEDAVEEAPKDPDQSVDAAAAEIAAEKRRDKEEDGEKLSDNELADQWGRDSVPSSNPPGGASPERDDN